MKRIQTMADVHALIADEQLPSFYVREIKDQFIMWHEAESEGESIDSFCLSNHSCIYHLDKEEDMHLIIDNFIDVEYVETEKIEKQMYFRIGLMQDHQMSIIYFLAGTLPRRVELWLAN